MFDDRGTMGRMRDGGEKREERMREKEKEEGEVSYPIESECDGITGYSGDGAGFEDEPFFADGDFDCGAMNMDGVEECGEEE